MQLPALPACSIDLTADSAFCSLQAPFACQCTYPVYSQLLASYLPVPGAVDDVPAAPAAPAAPPGAPAPP